MLESLKVKLKLLLGKGVRTSYGQFGEDATIQAFLKKVTSGVYVDVGAYHPILYSNTYALYKKGWRGLVIDPNPSLKPLYRSFRPGDTFVQNGIGSSSSATYYSFSDGAYNTLDETEAERRKAISGLSCVGEEIISIVSLSDVLKKYKILAIDLLNIDVEGKNLDVLKTLDWSIRPRLIAIEIDDYEPDRPQSNETYSFLRKQNYSLVGFAELTFIWKRIDI